MRPDHASEVDARYRAVRLDPTRSLSEFWEVSAELGELLLVDEPERAEEILTLAAQSLRERPHPADLDLSLQVLGLLADVRAALGRWDELRDALGAELRILEHAEVGIRSELWRGLRLRMAAAELGSERFDVGFDHLIDLIALSAGDDDDEWFDRVMVEVALASTAYAANRSLLATLEAALTSVRAEVTGLRREVSLAAVIALAQLSRDGIEVAEIYEQRMRTQAERLHRVPFVAAWASAAVALAGGDVERASDRFAQLLVRLRSDAKAEPDLDDPRVRFEALVGFGDARWRQGDAIAARTALTEALTLPSTDRRRRARCHEIYAELQRRDHRLDEAYLHLQATRELEEEFRPRAVALAQERPVSIVALSSSPAIVVVPNELRAVDAAPSDDPTPRASVDQSGIDQSGVDQSGIDQSGIDQSGDQPDDDFDDGDLDLRDAGSGGVESERLERRVESLEQLVDARTRQLERALVDLRDMSNRSQLDALTGLANRQRLNEVLAALVASGDRGAVLVLDLDRFGRINDALGHEAGDEMLVELARRLSRAVRSRDTVARWGGDEFVVLMPGLRDPAIAAATAEVIRQAVALPIKVGVEELVPSVSIGVAVATDGLVDPAMLLREADAALERAKSKGKGRVEVFGRELADHSRRRFDTEGLLRTALDRGLFELHFQPVHPNAAGEPLAAEALLRLREPTTGELLSPGAFLEVAEETGLAGPIGEWVFDAACEAAAGWSRLGVPFRFAVNVSASQLDDEFPALVADTLSRHGLSTDTLVIELTEHTLLAADGAQVEALVDIRETGVQTALDDFGTAYSSLSHLRQFPVDVVKIDRSFVAGICRSDQDNAIVRAVVDLSQTFHFRVVAEGVETTEQLDQQRRLGCHGAQGYLIGRPKPADVFGELLSTRPMFEALSRLSA